MNGKQMMHSAWIGVCTGMVLALFLKTVQMLTGKKVYTLLLNVDYMPILKNYQFPETVETGFHLVISVILCGIFIWLYENSRGFIRRRFILFLFLANTMIGLLLYPTVLLSVRTPDFADGTALFWWLAGHAVYGICAGLLIAKRTAAVSCIIEE